MAKADNVSYVENQKQDSVDWKEFEDASREIPVTACLPVPRFYYKLRWMVNQIFLWQVIPLFNGICLGEILLFLILPAFFGLAAYGSCCERESSGAVANIPIALTFIFATRNSFICFIFGVSYERALVWHKLLAFYAVALGIYHGWIANDSEDEDEEDGDSEVISGIIVLVIMGCLCAFSFFVIRRYIFEVFLKLHWVLFLVLIVGLVIHGAAMPVVVGGFFWILDLIIRMVIIARNRINTKTVQAHRLPGDVIKLTFMKKNFVYKSGQYVFICLPKMSVFEWHPFSISSSSFQNDVTIHIRVLGDWTKRLYEYITKHGDDDFQCFIDGPYGQPSVDIDSNKHKIFLFITGGIGITPMQSICNDLIYQIQRGRDIHKIYFIWSVRDRVMVTNILDYDKTYFLQHSPNVLPISFSPDLINTERNEGLIDAEFYLTRARNKEDLEKEEVHPKIKNHLNFGRPDFKDIFSRVHAHAKKINERNVAVLTCGPSKLVDDACMQSYLFTKEGIRFHFHSEVFEF